MFGFPKNRAFLSSNDMTLLVQTNKFFCTGCTWRSHPCPRRLRRPNRPNSVRNVFSHPDENFRKGFEKSQRLRLRRSLRAPQSWSSESFGRKAESAFESVRRARDRHAWDHHRDHLHQGRSEVGHGRPRRIGRRYSRSSGNSRTSSENPRKRRRQKSNVTTKEKINKF